MSKFDFDNFEGLNSLIFVISKKYSPQEANQIFKRETGDSPEDFVVMDGYVYYGFGYYDGERQHGWWLNYGLPSKRTHVPVYIYEWKGVKHE